MTRFPSPIHFCKDVSRNSRGQTLVEYGLLLVLIAVVVIGALTIVGQKANNTYTFIGNTLP
ncbi:MAG: Flp family type IVb pilin [Deltaproteobacteria bacterium]|nr:Flp family type IVb pilin [Deltaproteobacteria bacterium]